MTLPKFEIMAAINLTKDSFSDGGLYYEKEAALKHIDTAEKQPSQAVLSNIIGSYNIINASIN